jgi:6-phosphogluconolactonase (cycloisomerase 2 family)
VSATALWAGSYTADSGASGEGIAVLEIGTYGQLDRGALAVAADSPSFFAAHPTRPMIYAVSEHAGTVRAFRRSGTTGLEPSGREWRAGESACHVAVDPAGRFLVACCWGDGTVVAYELDEAGEIINRLKATRATDPYGRTERQSRGHASLFLPDGRVITTDLGLDLVRVWRYEPGVGLVADHEVTMPPDSEPRHLVRHPAGRVFVVGEVSCIVFVLAEGPDGRFALESSTSALDEGPRLGSFAAEVSLDPSNRFLRVGLRGANRIATLEIHDAGRLLERLGDVDCGGDWPRHHLEVPGRLFVANQRSGTVAAFRIDQATGLPVGPISTTTIGSPAFLHVIPPVSSAGSASAGGRSA